MNWRGQRRRSYPAYGATFWLRLVTAAVFAFYVNYLPFHLLTEPHSHDAAQDEMVESHDHHDPDHNGHSEHHVPHPSSEHAFEMLRKFESPAICLIFLAEISIALPEAPESDAVRTSVERIWSSGELSPEPSQPRAPPLC